MQFGTSLLAGSILPRGARPIGGPAPSGGGAGGGTFTVSGTVTTDGVTTVGGGIVELYSSGGALLNTATVNGSGAYSFANVENGTYYTMLHPPPTHCIKVGETGFDTEVPTGQPQIVVDGADVTNADFLVQTVFFMENFQSYANMAAVLHATTGVFASAKAIPTAGASVGTLFMSLTTDGPSNETVLNYNWTVADDPEINLVGGNSGSNFTDGLWVNVYGKVGKTGGGNFSPGSVEYKWSLVWWRRETSGSADNQAHIELQPSYMRAVMSAAAGGAGTTYETNGSQGCVYPAVSQPCNGSIPASEVWNLTTTRHLNVGTATQSLTYYHNGVKEFTLQGNMTNDVSTQVGLWQIGGANLNGAVPQDQYRRHRLWQVSEGRPSLRSVALIV